MKLWHKIALICGAVLTGVILVLSMGVMRVTQQRVLGAACERLAEKQYRVETEFLRQYGNGCGDGSSVLLEWIWLRRSISKVGVQPVILMLNGETVYSPITLKAGKAVSQSGLQNWNCFTSDTERGPILAVGRQVPGIPGDRDVFLYVFEDVTELAAELRGMLIRFLTMGLAAIAAGLWMIIWLVRRAMLPLERLKGAAVRISEGSYQERTGLRATDEVGELALCFDRMADSVQSKIEELTRINERQKRFISGVTHEFKTPLTGILLNTDALLNLNLDEDDQRESLIRIQTESQWLERMVQKLLKLISLDHEITLQMTDVPALLESVAKIASTQSRGIVLKTECTVRPMRLDRDLMISVLVNLVDNACKASKPGGTVYLRAEEGCFTVTDSGAGIPAEALDKVKEPFYTADPSRSKHLGGSGLGLALADEIVKAHGGELIVESVMGRGTTVRVKL